MVIAADEVVGPGGGLIEGPVPRRQALLFERFFFMVRFEPVVGPDVDAPSLSREDFAPSFPGAPALSVEKEFGTPGLRAEKGHLRQGAIAAAAAPGGEKLHPVFQLGEKSFES